MEHFGKTVRANQRCAEEVSAVLSGVGRRCHPPHLPPPGARRRRLRKIKNLLGPPPEHRRIQFHRLNIKNDARLVGLIKTLDLVSSSPTLSLIYFQADRSPRGPFSLLFLWMSTATRSSTSSSPRRSTAGSSSTDSTSRTTTDSRAIKMLDLVKYCSENNKRLIHFSTCEVYGNAIGSFPPKDHSLLQVNKFFRFAVVDGVSFA
ncbi:UDP-D-apiose/UDP-D-xylose synthase-like isoform X4 [Ananas comosus]|uniref:UDP-D-apiose/UDP-D-xylose synthase-like isoform X4 n=1 Tax=Ananas comosus TaxID=4615 RepID=A0A6P5F0T2_ANACO|nr:UDP-D-apiose/UDP-D-xylose synthase-like isoform X4 [Ananas comosus]